MQLTQEAKIASHFHFIGAIFAFVGFVSALSGSAGLPRGAAAPFNYLSVFFSPMESRAFKMIPKIAAPAMQGTFSPKKGMLPPKDVYKRQCDGNA